MEDPISRLVAARKLPIGDASRVAILWIQENLDFALEPFSTAVDSSLRATRDALLFLPPTATIALACVVAAAISRGWRLPLFCALGFGLVLNQGYWERSMATLALILWATGVCMLVGVPVGVFCARRPRFYRVAQPVLDMMQTLPTFVYLIPMLALFGLGFVPGLVATIIFAIPAVVRLTCLGVRSTPRHLVEVGHACGATPPQILRLIEFPHAKASVLAGMNQCIMLSLSMVVIAALVGTPGLGVPVVRALNSGPRGIALGFEAGVCIVLLAILIDRLFRSQKPARGAGAQS